MRDESPREQEAATRRKCLSRLQPNADGHASKQASKQEGWKERRRRNRCQPAGRKRSRLKRKAPEEDGCRRRDVQQAGARGRQAGCTSSQTGSWEREGAGRFGPAELARSLARLHRTADKEHPAYPSGELDAAACWKRGTGSRKTDLFAPPPSLARFTRRTGEPPRRARPAAAPWPECVWGLAWTGTPACLPCLPACLPSSRPRQCPHPMREREDRWEGTGGRAAKLVPPSQRTVVHRRVRGRTPRRINIYRVNGKRAGFGVGGGPASRPRCECAAWLAPPTLCCC